MLCDAAEMTDAWFHTTWLPDVTPANATARSLISGLVPSVTCLLSS